MTSESMQYAARIAICDDEPEVCLALARAVYRYGEEHGMLFAVKVFHSGEELLDGFDPAWQILFLDISMGEIDGMQTAKALRQLYGDNLRIVFITSLEQYAMDGYSVHAFGFLVKPVSYERLHFLLDDVLRSLAAAQRMQLAVQTEKGTEVIDTGDLYYVESLAHRMRLVGRGGSLLCTMPLKELEGKLERGGFVRCHRSYLVNMEHIVSVKTDECVMTNGDRVPISRGKRAEFQQAFNKYVGTLL